MKNYIEKLPRTMAKVLSWRIIMIIQYTLLGYFTTGSWAFGIGLAGVTTIINSTIYFLHERLWNEFGWGKDAV
jgi:uncharacterized membrane protein